MITQLELHRVTESGLLESEARLLQETEELVQRCFQAAVPPLKTEPKDGNEMVENMQSFGNNQPITRVGDARFKLYPEESGDGYVRQLVETAAFFIVNKVHQQMLVGNLDKAMLQELVWQAYLAWRDEYQQRLYRDADVDRVTMTMIRAWAKRQIYYLHHMGAAPYQSQLGSQFNNGRSRELSVDAQYAAYLLLALLLEDMLS